MPETPFPWEGNPHVTEHRWRDPQYGAAFYIFSRLSWHDKRRA